jgi:N-acetylmuramoyl-L-alanine amidase
MLKKKYFNLVALLLVLSAILLFSEKGVSVMKHLLNHSSYQITVAIDAGHGGFDPGKIGVNNAKEKDINLSIAYKLKKLLERNNINVIMTRVDDNGLYEKNDYDKKTVDMRKRVSIINSSNAFIAISIHQNSFTQESSWGAQVFYHEKSEEGKILGGIIQNSIKSYINDGNHRLARANTSYYMLRKTKCPLVIVECGFLSNWKEANLLGEEAYQDKMAEAIQLGILEYINQYQ